MRRMRIGTVFLNLIIVMAIVAISASLCFAAMPRYGNPLATSTAAMTANHTTKQVDQAYQLSRLDMTTPAKMITAGTANLNSANAATPYWSEKGVLASTAADNLTNRWTADQITMLAPYYTMKTANDPTQLALAPAPTPMAPTATSLNATASCPTLANPAGNNANSRRPGVQNLKLPFSGSTPTTMVS